MKYKLMRQDGNGQKFLVRRSDSREELDKQQKELERKAHKQIYWIEAEGEKDELGDIPAYEIGYCINECCTVTGGQIKTLCQNERCSDRKKREHYHCFECGELL